MNILGYVIYGVGTLVIIAFLWSAVRRQQQESRNEFPDEIIKTTSEQEEVLETAPEPFIQTQASVQDLNATEGFYENGPETEELLYQSASATFETKTEPVFEVKEVQQELPIVDFTPDINKLEVEPPIAPSFSLDKDPEPQRTAEDFETRTDSESIIGGGEIFEAELPTHLIAINIVAPRGHAFYGSDILDAFERQGLILNEKQIYHAVNNHQETMFSVASSIEPGIFDVNFMDRYTTPGLTFFVDLNSTAQPKTAFKKMLTCAYEISRSLNGDLLDHRRQRLTESSVVEYLAQIKGIESVRSVLSQ